MYTATNLSKTYGSTRALDSVTFAVESGEVHALLGMNGAGKSTLVKLLVGVEQADTGVLTLNDAPLTLSSLRDAFGAGIAVVAQDLNLFPELTVLANLFLLREPRRFGLVDTKAMTERAQKALTAVGVAGMDPRMLVSQLTPSDRQRVAVARSILFAPRVLLLDEPTSALQPHEKQRLLEVVRSLRSQGSAIVYVSHFLEEVFSIADRLTVLRDGRVVVPGVRTDATTLPETVRAMTGSASAVAPTAPVGRTGDLRLEREDNSSGGLTAEGLSRTGQFADVSLRVGAGEILGLAGLEGSGARSILTALFGSEPAETGSVRLPGGRQGGRGITASVRAGVAYVPADRQASGVMVDASILDNLMQVRVAALGREGTFLNHRALAHRAAARVEQLGIKLRSLDDPLTSLSGGNQQKVLLGKWLEADAEVYLLDDPTAAVDVHARAEVHAVIRAIAAAGHSVIITSSEPAELLDLCDRIGVMHSGRLTTILPNRGLSSHDLLEAINTGTAPGHGAPDGIADSEGVINA